LGIFLRFERQAEKMLQIIGEHAFTAQGLKHRHLHEKHHSSPKHLLYRSFQTSRGVISSSIVIQSSRKQQSLYCTMAEQRKAVIKNADMSDPMQQDAVDIASVALSKYNIEKVG
jgi:hypothetical protein